MFPKRWSTSVRECIAKGDFSSYNAFFSYNRSRIDNNTYTTMSKTNGWMDIVRPGISALQRSIFNLSNILSPIKKL